MALKDRKPTSDQNMASTCQKVALHRYYGIVLPSKQVIEAVVDWPRSALKGLERARRGESRCNAKIGATNPFRVLNFPGSAINSSDLDVAVAVAVGPGLGSWVRDI